MGGGTPVSPKECKRLAQGKIPIPWLILWAAMEIPP
jgi:hypothetical protein